MKSEYCIVRIIMVYLLNLIRIALILNLLIFVLNGGNFLFVVLETEDVAKNVQHTCYSVRRTLQFGQKKIALTLQIKTT